MQGGPVRVAALALVGTGIVTVSSRRERDRLLPEGHVRGVAELRRDQGGGGRG